MYISDLLGITYTANHKLVAIDFQPQMIRIVQPFNSKRQSNRVINFTFATTLKTAPF